MSITRDRLLLALARASLRVLPDMPYNLQPGRRFRWTVRFLEWRYQLALRIGGRETARDFDYVPF